MWKWTARYYSPDEITALECSGKAKSSRVRRTLVNLLSAQFPKSTEDWCGGLHSYMGLWLMIVRWNKTWTGNDCGEVCGCSSLNRPEFENSCVSCGIPKGPLLWKTMIRWIIGSCLCKPTARLFPWAWINTASNTLVQVSLIHVQEIL